MSRQQSSLGVAQGSLNGDALASALEWVKHGHRVAIATVINTTGSSPLPIGTQMAISDEGSIAGSVAGGCSEVSVFEAARAVLSSGAPRRLKLGNTNINRGNGGLGMPWEVDLSCGGEIELYIEPLQ